MNELKKIILDRYGSVDQFIQFTGIKISRIHIFKLLSGERQNPTLESLMALAEALDMSIGDIADALHNRHRD